MPGGASRVAVDTSVAVPLLLRNHPSHQALMSWRDGRQLPVCGHAWIETYAVLTRLPGSARVTPVDAARVMRAMFTAPVSMSRQALGRAIDELVDAGIAGGASYDGWIALAARESRSVLATRDLRATATYRRFGVEVELLDA